MYRPTTSCIRMYLSVALLCLSVELNGAEPTDIGVPYLVEQTTGKLIPLERQRANASMRMKALGLGGGSSVIRFNGRASPVRVGSNGIKLVIRFASAPPAPSSLISLDGLEVKKSSREAVLIKVGPLGFGGRSTMGDAEIELTFQAGTDSTTITFEPKVKLAPGEYVVTIKDTPYAYLFAVQ